MYDTQKKVLLPKTWEKFVPDVGKFRPIRSHGLSLTLKVAIAAMAQEAKSDVGGMGEESMAATVTPASPTDAEPVGGTSTSNSTPQRGGKAGEKAQFKEERDFARKQVEELNAELRKFKEERDGALKQAEESFLTRLLNRS
jgi:hypothetical protein